MKLIYGASVRNAMPTVCGENEDGWREILAAKPMSEESEASYTVRYSGN